MSGQQSGWLRDEISASELSEVYLLLDHISGRKGKSFASGPNAAAESLALINSVCAIAWAPPTADSLTPDQAATLLDARDRLNDAAWPANGASIAFTLLVTNSDTGAPAAIARPHTDGGKPPTRAFLAATAFPGLVRTARRFRTFSRWAVGGLIGWLVLTCALSWNVASGTAILAGIDRFTHAKAELIAQSNITGRVMTADQLRLGGDVMTSYCTAHRTDDVRTMSMCDALDENRIDHRIAYADLADWLTIWGWLKWLPRTLVCHGACLANGPGEKALTPNAMDEQWASILVAVLANSVLPVFYGVLGSAAAIVRMIWARLRDSLLSPRDVTLSLMQLALGAVIGSCIGLFVTPTGAPTQNAVPSLISTVTLSASALSFIGGFGVESVFEALEGFIKRIFNPEAGANGAPR